MKYRCKNERGRFMSDLLEMSQLLIKEGFLVTVDIEKAFESVDHLFLVAILEKLSFGIEFIEWIKILLNN